MRTVEKTECVDLGQQQKHAFNILEDELSSNRVLALYDPKRETIVSAGACSFGLGSVLLQRQPTGEMPPVAYASRSMTDTERLYAQIEKETLATTWALDNWADLLIGMQFRVETDHRHWYLCYPQSYSTNFRYA